MARLLLTVVFAIITVFVDVLDVLDIVLDVLLAVGPGVLRFVWE
jgi:hypothetical protein